MGDRMAGIEAKVAVLVVMVVGLYAIALPSLWLVLRIARDVGALDL